MSDSPDRGAASAAALEVTIGHLLVAGTYLAMSLMVVGVVLMLAKGVDPLAHAAFPPFKLTAIPGQMLALDPIGFLWAGVVTIVALPVGRVVVAGLGFLAAGDRRLALVSLAVLAVVLVSVAAALGLEG
jgi:uncharacterized membrane protein